MEIPVNELNTFFDNFNSNHVLNCNHQLMWFCGNIAIESFKRLGISEIKDYSFADESKGIGALALDLYLFESDYGTIHFNLSCNVSDSSVRIKLYHELDGDYIWDSYVYNPKQFISHLIDIKRIAYRYKKEYQKALSKRGKK